MIVLPIKILLIVNLLALNIVIAGSEAGIQSNMHATSSTTCLCPGGMLRYECTIVGGGTTVWRGSAFMTCNYIALLHSRFTQGTSGTCNSGSIIGKSLRVENGSYTSQLNITLSREQDESSIECIHDNSTQLLTVGMSKVELKDPVPPPDRILLSLDHPGWLIFSWNEVVTGCKAVQYRIIASNCGSCPAITAHTTAVCTNIPTNSNMCTFALQTIVCDDVAGNVSDPIHALLRVPDPPMGLKVIPRYSYASGQFSGMTVEFNTERSIFKITDEVDGSTLSHTLIYTADNSDSVCGSTTIPASLCNSRTCKYVFEFEFEVDSSFPCRTSNTYNVSVFAANLLGNGYPSSIITTLSDSVNVSVSFDLSSKQVICNFADHDLRNEKTCKILYGPGNECKTWNSTKTITSSVTNIHSDSVTIGLTSLLNKEPINCFIATMTSGTFVAEIEGTLNTASKLDSNNAISDRIILAISLGVAITVVAMAISVVIHITIIVARSRVKKRSIEKCTCTSTNRVATEPPVIYEDLDQVHKDIDLDNNMAYSLALTQPH